jgi:hypothetical protein
VIGVSKKKRRKEGGSDIIASFPVYPAGPNPELRRLSAEHQMRKGLKRILEEQAKKDD